VTCCLQLWRDGPSVQHDSAGADDLRFGSDGVEAPRGGPLRCGGGGGAPEGRRVAGRLNQPRGERSTPSRVVGSSALPPTEGAR
jgi:hypothetical protein